MSLITFLTQGIRAQDLQDYNAANNRGTITLRKFPEHRGIGEQTVEVVKTVYDRIQNIVATPAPQEDDVDDLDGLQARDKGGLSAPDDSDDETARRVSWNAVSQHENPYQPTFEETGYCLVDNIILVQGQTSAERSVNEEFWEFNRNIMILTGIIGVVGSVAGLVVSVVATSTIVVLTASVVSFASPFFAALCFYRAFQAHDQMQEWSVAPAVTVANQRAAAYREGFFYALAHNLKADPDQPSPNGVLFMEEVKYLYMQSFEKFQKAARDAYYFSEAGKTAVLNDFVQRGFLTQQAILFTSPLGASIEDVPEYFKNGKAAYEKFCAKYAGFGAYLAQKKHDVATQHREFHTQLDQQKEGFLKPHKQQLESQKASINSRFQPLMRQLQIEQQESGDVPPSGFGANFSPSPLEHRGEDDASSSGQLRSSVAPVSISFAPPMGVSSQFSSAVPSRGVPAAYNGDGPSSAAQGSSVYASAFMSPPPASALLSSVSPQGVSAGYSRGSMGAPSGPRMAGGPSFDVPAADSRIAQTQREWHQALREADESYAKSTASIEVWYTQEVQRLDQWQLDLLKYIDQRKGGYLDRYLQTASSIIGDAYNGLRAWDGQSIPTREIPDSEYDIVEIHPFRISSFSSFRERRW